MLRVRGKSMKRACRSRQSRNYAHRRVFRGRQTARLMKGGPPMRLLLTTAALGALMVASSAVPASAQQSKDCGKYGMTCAPMAKSPNYTSGVQASDCGKYGMTCAKGATTASVTPGLATRERLTTGRSVATRVSTRREGVRVGTRRATEVRTAAAYPAATAPVAA